METAFERHATSKIKTERDLFNIVTLGFRGEALPSIASVSHLTMRTSTGSGAGVELKLEGGQAVERKAAKSRKGTEIVVKNLFYNTPARLKYLKTVHTEAGNVSDIVNRLALAHPNVAFEFFHNGKSVLQTSGNGDQRQVIAAIYGRNVARNMVPIKGRSLDYTVTGYIAKPEITRASRQYMSLFINGRFIRNYPLARAVQEGYHTLLPIGRHPIVILSIEMDPTLIDVNVHPSKLEVRLSKEAELCELITEAIKKQFQQTSLIPTTPLEKPRKIKAEQIPFDFREEESTSKSQPAEVRESRPELAKVEGSASVRDAGLWEKEAVEESNSPSTDVQEEERFQSLNEQKEAPKAPSEPLVEETTTEPRIPTLYPVGQMHGTYIIAQNENGMYVIDQHAAQERIKYEDFRDKLAQVEPQLQELLVPITIECTNQEAELIEEHREQLIQVGVFLEPFGPQTYMIRSHPSWLPKGRRKKRFAKWSSKCSNSVGST